MKLKMNVITYFYNHYFTFSCVCIYVIVGVFTYEFTAYKGQKMVLDALELELYVVVNHQPGAGD